MASEPAIDLAAATHPHEPAVAPVYDAEGRCLICCLAVERKHRFESEQQLIEISAFLKKDARHVVGNCEHTIAALVKQEFAALERDLTEARAEAERLKAEQIVEREEWNVFAGIRRPPCAPALIPKDARLLKAIFEPVDDTGPDEP